VHDGYALADLALARRLERAEASANAASVEARAAAEPAVGACWRDVGGAYAMFDGIGSPITQTFGLGLFSPGDEDDLGRLEAFFAERGADVFHEVSPIADLGLPSRLSARGYRPVEFTSVLHQPVTHARSAPAGGRASALRARVATAGDADTYADIAARGWSSESPEIGAFVRAYAALTARTRGVHTFLAERDGEPVATAALAMHGGVAILAGASTVPEARGQGAQAALLALRLAVAADAGCDRAMMAALPGSASQRNAERLGFRIAYTRIKWGRGG
jgi:GNAT superfamily N-acetyltransferase